MPSTEIAWNQTPFLSVLSNPELGKDDERGLRIRRKEKMEWTGDGNRGMGRNNREKRARRLQAVVPCSALKRPSDPS